MIADCRDEKRGNWFDGIIKLDESFIEHCDELSKEFNEQIDKEFVLVNFSPNSLERLTQCRAEFTKYIGRAIKVNPHIM